MTDQHGGNIYAAPCELDFSANINPLGTPPGVIEAACEGVRRSTAYPDPQAGVLRDAIAAKHGLQREQVICGNGAAELIFLVCDALRPKKALLLSPCFSEYERALCKVCCETVFYPCPAEEGFVPGPDYETYLTSDTDIAFLCIPNNPTGAMMSRSRLLRIADLCERNRIFLVMDECFVPLTDAGEANSLSDLVMDHPHLFILRAFTKLYAMPGLRLGYGLSADEQLLKKMRGCSQPWNVSLPAQMAGVAALRETDFEERSRSLITQEKACLLRELQRLGLTCFKPGANFIFFRGPETLGEQCLKRGILIRDCSHFRGLQKGYWRAAVRSHEENARLIEVLEAIVTIVD